jgi:hypothetical protein
MVIGRSVVAIPVGLREHAAAHTAIPPTNLAVAPLARLNL